MVYAYYDATTTAAGGTKELLHSWKPLYDGISALKEVALHSTTVYEERLQTLVRGIVQISSLPLRLRTRQLVCDYSEEVVSSVAVEDMFNTPSLFSPDLFFSMLLNAPSIACCAEVTSYVLMKLGHLKQILHQDRHHRAGTSRGVARGADSSGNYHRPHYGTMPLDMDMLGDQLLGGDDDDVNVVGDGDREGGEYGLYGNYSKYMRDLIERVSKYFCQFDFAGLHTDHEEELEALGQVLDLLPEDGNCYRQVVLGAALKNKRCVYMYMSMLGDSLISFACIVY
jgi:hypothetical protein